MEADLRGELGLEGNEQGRYREAAPDNEGAAAKEVVTLAARGDREEQGRAQWPDSLVRFAALCYFANTKEP